MIRTLILLHHLENARGELVARGFWDTRLPDNTHNAAWAESAWLADSLIAKLRGIRAAQGFKDHPPLPEFAKVVNFAKGGNP